MRITQGSYHIVASRTLAVCDTMASLLHSEGAPFLALRNSVQLAVFVAADNTDRCLLSLCGINVLDGEVEKEMIRAPADPGTTNAEKL